MYLKTYFVFVVLVFHINSSVAQYFANRPPYDDKPLSIPVAIVYDKPVLTLRPYKKAIATTYRPKYSVVTEVSSTRVETLAKENREVNADDVEVKATEAGANQIGAILPETEEAVITTEAAVIKTEATVTTTEEAVKATEETVIGTEGVVTGIEAVTATEANLKGNEAALTETDSFEEQTTKLPTYRRIYTPKKAISIRKYIDISKLREQRNKKVVIQEPKPKTVVNNEYQVPVVVVYDDQAENQRNYVSQPRKYKKRIQRRRFKPKVAENTENILITKVGTESPQLIMTEESAIQDFETSTTVNTKEPRTPLQLLQTATPQNLEPTLLVNTRVMNRPIEITTSNPPSVSVISKIRTQRRRLKVKKAKNTENAPTYSKSSTTVSYTEEKTSSPQILTIQESTKQNSETVTSVLQTKVTNKPSAIIKTKQQDSIPSTAFVSARVSNRPLEITAGRKFVSPSAFVNSNTRTQRRRFKVKTAENTDNVPRYLKNFTTVEQITGSPQIVTTQKSTTQNSKTFDSVLNNKVTDIPSTLKIDNVLNSLESSTEFVKTRVSDKPLKITPSMESEQPSAFVNTKTRTLRRRFKVKKAENTDNAQIYSKTLVNTEIRTQPPQILTTHESKTQNSGTLTFLNTIVTSRTPQMVTVTEPTLRYSENFASAVNTRITNRLPKITTENTVTESFIINTKERSKPLQIVITTESVPQNSETFTSVVNTRVASRPSPTLSTKESSVLNAQITSRSSQLRRSKESSPLNSGTFTSVVNTTIPSRPSQTLLTKESSAVTNAQITSTSSRLRTAKESSARNSGTLTSFENTRVSSRVPQIATTESTRVRSKSSQIIKSAPQNSGTFTSVVNTKVTRRPSTITVKETATVVPKIFSKRTYDYVKTPFVPIVDSESYVFSDAGNYHYRYEGGDGTKAFERGELKEYNNDLTGEAVVGGFSYKDKDGNDFSLSYTADENGYRPVGAHLPTPPPIPIAIARALEYLATKTTDSDSTTESL